MKTYQSIFNPMLKLFVLIGIIFTMQNCDVLNPDEEENEKITDTLYVKFVNNANSVATVNYFSYQAMGKAGEATSTPSGSWSNNVIKNGQKVQPGGSIFFTLKIPNLHWARYHLGIIDDLGNEILLHEQTNFNEQNLPVTHWGGDTRTISTRITKDGTTGKYSTSGYSDWVGID